MDATSIDQNVIKGIHKRSMGFLQDRCYMLLMDYNLLSNTGSDSNAVVISFKLVVPGIVVLILQNTAMKLNSS